MLGFAVGRWGVGSLCGNYHKNYHTKSKIKYKSKSRIE